MFGKKKTDTPQVEQAVAKAVSYEVTVADMARRSQRRAWLVAWCATVLALILAGGYFFVMPLKEKVPYLVMADPYTGTATVARLQGNFGKNSITTQEAINKSNVAQFVKARESYDSGEIIGQRNWDTVHVMGGPQVTPAYEAVHAQNNPQRPYALYGTDKAVHVRILSIQLIGGGGGQPYTGATVRFQRSLFHKDIGRSDPIDSKIATLEFTYRSNMGLDDEGRLLNPLGFWVTNYRVENDYAESPPLEPVFPPPSAVPQQSPQQPPVQMPATDGGAETVPGAPASGDESPVNPDAAAPAQTPAATAPANGVNTQ